MAKNFIYLLLLLSLNSFSNPNKKALENMNGCYACHSVKVKIIGPSFIEISKKYKNQSVSRNDLVKKIRDGGSGNWGSIPMIAHPNISEEDLSFMVDWILSLK